MNTIRSQFHFFLFLCERYPFLFLGTLLGQSCTAPHSYLFTSLVLYFPFCFYCSRLFELNTGEQHTYMCTFYAAIQGHLLSCLETKAPNAKAIPRQRMRATCTLFSSPLLLSSHLGLKAWRTYSLILVCLLFPSTFAEGFGCGLACCLDDALPGLVSRPRRCRKLVEFRNKSPRCVPVGGSSRIVGQLLLFFLLQTCKFCALALSLLALLHFLSSAFALRVSTAVSSLQKGDWKALRHVLSKLLLCRVDFEKDRFLYRNGRKHAWTDHAVAKQRVQLSRRAHDGLHTATASSTGSDWLVVHSSALCR